MTSITFHLNTAQSYKWQWKDLTVQDMPNGQLVLYKSSRVLIPDNAKEDFLDDLHSSHPSLQQMLRAATYFAYWKTMQEDITARANRCQVCLEVRRVQYKPPPLDCHEDLDLKPGDCLIVDYMSFNGVYYHVAVDATTDFLWVVETKAQSCPRLWHTLSI